MNVEINEEIEIEQADDEKLGGDNVEEGADSENDTPDDDAEEVEDSVSVTIGDEEPPASEDLVDGKPAAPWIRELRKTNRELVRKNKELEQKINAPAAAETPVVATPKPKLSDPDVDYDEDAFEAKLTNWHKQQAAIAAEQQKVLDAKKAADDEWQERVGAYNTAKTDLKAKDFEEVEAVAKDILSVTQQGIIMTGAKNAAKLMYALGKYPEQAKALAAIKNHVKFAFEVAELETKLKVTSTSKKAPPPPERQVRGSSAVSGGSDATLDKLRAEAAKSGDMTKVLQYKAKLRAAKQ